MYKTIVGLEIHVELDTKSKMFCSCPNDPDERNPNVNICPICLGHPGVLPVINQEAVRRVIKTGLALNCQIPEYSQFDRKNYFYPDLPKGYQISQLYQPLCRNGFLEIAETSSHLSLRSALPSSEMSGKKIRIREVHLEEDTGSLVHPPGTNYSLVDFNRAGVSLMELVTEPDITSAKEARKFAEELQLILRYLGVSGADMEKGQLRVEANISLTKTKKLGTKVEIKNLNSFRAVERGIDYEIKRQTKILSSGKKVIQETRGWHDAKEITFSQRGKEQAHDYRYFPEPDLPPLHFTKEEINQIRAEIPELPRQRRERFTREYELNEEPIEIFVYNKNLGEYFEKVISELPPRLSQEKLSKLIKLSTNYIITDLQGLLKGTSVVSKDFLITPENFAEFITLITRALAKGEEETLVSSTTERGKQSEPRESEDERSSSTYEGKISSKIAKMVLEEMFKTGADPSHIIKEKGLIQITDQVEIEKIIREVIVKNPKAVEDYKKGKANAFQYLIGQIMAQTEGKANPRIIRDILNKVL